MAVVLGNLATVLRSSLCDVDQDVYRDYLGAVSSIARAFGSSCHCGSGGVDAAADDAVVARCACGHCAAGVNVQWLVRGRSCAAILSGKDAYDGGLCVDGVCEGTNSCGIELGAVREDDVVDGESRVVDNLADAGIDSVSGVGGCDGGSREQVGPSLTVLGSPGFVDQSGFVHVSKLFRNRANRAIAKKKKTKRQAMGQDWRVRDVCNASSSDSTGRFWNSTSKDVRQQLVDSKARMHIAENERREREARDKIAYMDSPEAAMRKAIGMIEYAEKQAKKENDNKVYGWAKTVAISSAESLARSASDSESVPGFDVFSAKLEVSSQSSFEAALKAKDVEISELKSVNDLTLKEKEKVVNEYSCVERKHKAVVKRMRELEERERIQIEASRVRKPVVVSKELLAQEKDGVADLMRSRGIKV